MSRIDFVTGAPERYADLVEGLATVSLRLRDAVAGASTAQLSRETTDEWSPARIMGHMLLYARANGIFIRQMATMTDPDRAAVEESESEILAKWEASRLLDEIEAALGDTVDLLSVTPDASWGRPGRIRGARRSLRQQVKSHTDHMNEHIDQIAGALQGA